MTTKLINRRLDFMISVLGKTDSEDPAFLEMLAKTAGLWYDEMSLVMDEMIKTGRSLYVPSRRPLD